MDRDTAVSAEDMAIAQAIWDRGHERIAGEAMDASLMAERAHVAEIASYIASSGT